MGCLKLSYYEQERALEVNPIFFTSAVEKKRYAEKNRLSSSTYGFNGKEMDNEIDGVTGSKLDFGARIYDSRLARWLSLDPQAGKYPFMSPYVAFGNNPIYYTDPGGDTLVVSANARLTDKFKSVLKASFSGKVEATVDENGVTDIAIVEGAVLTKLEYSSYIHLKYVITHEETVTLIPVDIESGGADIPVGQFTTGKINLDKIAAFGTDQNLTSRGKFVHESMEQLEKILVQYDIGKKITFHTEEEYKKIPKWDSKSRNKLKSEDYNNFQELKKCHDCGISSENKGNEEQRID